MRVKRTPTDTAIIEAAFEVLSANPGASLSDIAERAGVGRATLHRHYRSRDTLIVVLMKQALAELDDAVDQATAGASSYTDALRLALGAIVPLAERQLFLANEQVDRDPEIAAAFRDGRQTLIATIEVARAEGTFAADIPASWIATAFDMLIYAAWTQVRDGEATHRQATDLAWRTLTRGLAGDAP